MLKKILVACGMLSVLTFAEEASLGKSGALNSMAIGPAFLAGFGSENSAYLLSLGKVFPATDYAAVRFKTNVAVDFSGVNLFGNGALGVQAYVLEGDITPYGFVDFGFGYGMDEKGLDSYGFTLGAGPGLLLFRKASAQVFLEPIWQIILTKQAHQLYGLKVGINF